MAKDGEEAIEMFKKFEKKPKLILMDYRLPKKNGLETTKEILKLDQNAQIIFITADSSIKELALASGVLKFLDKCFTIKEFIDEIKQVM